MKKALLPILLVFLLLLSFIPCVQAAQTDAYVVDDAQLLSAGEENALLEKILSLQSKYQMDIVILTVASTGGQSPMDFADDYFDYNGYGFGKNSSGILFLLSMEDRDRYISTTGDAMVALSDYAAQESVETVIPYLSDGEYYNGFSVWLNNLPHYLDAYEAGTPIQEPEATPSVLLAVVIGLAVAVIVILIMRAAMNSKRQQHSARHYLRSGSYHLRTNHNIFLYSSVTKTQKPKETSSGHTGSSGRSHGGSGGKF